MEIDIATTIAIVLIVVQAAGAIAKLTKTTKDDNIVQKARKVLDFIGRLGLPDRIEVPLKKRAKK